MTRALSLELSLPAENETHEKQGMWQIGTGKIALRDPRRDSVSFPVRHLASWREAAASKHKQFFFYLFKF